MKKLELYSSHIDPILIMIQRLYIVLPILIYGSSIKPSSLSHSTLDNVIYIYWIIMYKYANVVF